MPFVLMNAPSTFMSLMNEVLKYFIGKFVIIYLDDILVFSKTEEEHLRHLKMVLRRLQQEKLLVNLKKFYFMKTKLVYLGFVIFSNELKMDPEKVRAIREWPSPRSVFEVRSFHGLAIFYRKFIRNFNSVCVPILDTIKKEHGYFDYTKEADKVFDDTERGVNQYQVQFKKKFNLYFNHIIYSIISNEQ
jgi:hypothetical protein